MSFAREQNDSSNRIENYRIQVRIIHYNSIRYNQFYVAVATLLSL